MSIHQTIYDTINMTDEEVMELIGAGDINSVISRRLAMTEFLLYNKWSLASYKKWLLAVKWTPKQTSIGFGDTVAKLTKSIGITPCGGCKKRQATLNAIFPYKER